jgi:hypothetical protein
MMTNFILLTTNAFSLAMRVSIFGISLNSDASTIFFFLAFVRRTRARLPLLEWRMTMAMRRAFSCDAFTAMNKSCTSVFDDDRFFQGLAIDFPIWDDSCDGPGSDTMFTAFRNKIASVVPFIKEISARENIF